MMNSKMVAVVVSGLLALTSAVALAHGETKARHGGVVATAGELHLELVGTPTGAVIYIDDHGKAVSPAGMSGKLTVLTGTEKSEAPLVPTGERLEAKGVKLGPGAKVVAVLTTPTKKSVTARFTIK